MKVDSLKIVEFQKEKGINGNALAEKCGITARTLSRIKTNESTWPVTARKIASALGVDLSEIQKKEEKQHENNRT